MKNITDEEIRSLTSAIKSRYDLDFTCYEMGSLKRRISRSLSTFSLESTHELWIKVLRENGFIHKLVNELSVGLTSMFRDPSLWIRLKEILPAFIEERGKIKVWHSGCSTGEEVFTFNIILEELGLRDKVSSVATDMNTDALNAAKLGNYHLMKLADYKAKYSAYNPKGNFEDYYTLYEKHGQMNPSLLRNVEFIENNLITDDLRDSFDIIFCRNVMIYFDRIAKKNVLDKFHNNLKKEGLFIIGYFDSLVNVIDKNQYQYFDLPAKIFSKSNESNSVGLEVGLKRKKLNLLIHLAKIDSVMHRSEQLIINELIESEGLKPEEFDSSETNSDIQFLTEIDKKVEMFYSILRVMKADGQIMPSELLLCKKIAGNLGYTQDAVEKYAYGVLPSYQVFEQELKSTIYSIN